MYTGLVCYVGVRACVTLEEHLGCTVPESRDVFSWITTWPFTVFVEGSILSGFATTPILQPSRRRVLPELGSFRVS